jgi:hypothetical protein
MVWDTTTGVIFTSALILLPTCMQMWEVPRGEGRRMMVEWGSEFDEFDPVTQVGESVRGVRGVRGTQV